MAIFLARVTELEAERHRYDKATARLREERRTLKLLIEQAVESRAAAARDHLVSRLEVLRSVHRWADADGNPRNTRSQENGKCAGALLGMHAKSETMPHGPSWKSFLLHAPRQSSVDGTTVVCDLKPLIFLCRHFWACRGLWA